jgi:uncharacterized protein YkwD
MARPLVLALSLALLTILPAPAAEATGTSTYLTDINDARAEGGMRPLRPSRSLGRSSLSYSFWMLEHQSFRHLPGIRASRRFSLRGEVLAMTPAESPTAESVVRRWMASPAHRAVLMNPRFRYIGVGVAAGWLGDEPATFVTGHLGGPRRR